MTIDELHKLWEIESVIDMTNIARVAADIPRLHNRYSKLYWAAKKVLRKLDAEYQKLRREKYAFYDAGPDKKNDKHEQWALPAKGKAITKKELEFYIDTDEDLIAARNSISDQEDIVKFLESILSTINSRSFQLRIIVDMKKFEAGLN